MGRRAAMDVTFEAGQPPRAGASQVGHDPFPMREYIGAMAAELAAMARHEGDEPLARVLEQAVGIAERAPSSDRSGR
ncbi:MAG: hypothetical protein ACK4E3_01170 [Brevundimonas sp.]|jgi:hypothetical protein|uniref:hypothetical protein n=1 Tax=Brevundimonas sp. TaxID=1871086 RepID=UPI0039189FC3